MNRRVPAARNAAMALTALLLAGCEPPPQATVIYPEAPPMLPAPAAARPEPLVVEPGPDFGEGLPDPANAVCMSAVSDRTGEFNVRVLENATLAEGTEVTVGVGAEQTRWRCVAGPGGEVVEVGEVGGLQADEEEARPELTPPAG